MMPRNLISAALVLVSALSLAPQALVCGTIQKHRCSCCDAGDACSCCTIAPLYPDQAAASPETASPTVPDAWTPVAEFHPVPGPSEPVAGPLVETVHGPPLLLQTSLLRI